MRHVRQSHEGGASPYAVPAAGASGPVVVFTDGRERVNLASNNYLGLTDDPRVRAAARDAVDRYGTGVSGSRLLNGTTDLVLELEAELADFYGVEACVVTTSGYTANLALLSAVGRPGDALLLDAAAHASLHAGAAASAARVLRWRHNDLDALRRRLGALEEDAGVVVVVDGVYSMEGTCAPLRELVALCREHGARLVVDEAHGVGVLGALGRGACEEAGVLGDVDAVTLTTSKALASCGGAVLTSAAVAEGLRGSAAPYLFAAGQVPAAVAAALAAVRVLRAEPERVAALADRAAQLREELAAAGVPVVASRGAVVGVPVGEEREVVEVWRRVFAAGAATNAVVHPAVPRGGALLRLSVMSTHTDEQLARGAAAVAAGLARPERLPAPRARVVDLRGAGALKTGA
ncbi:aminotransferase class I/II-fold pyridoxal phosphate-dependent enzyme [Streptomyces sp. NP160]|uniref:aminotransferase class I/II-fold pyridoxal phosphate-dependent enzyme n=1 Tax=Streptomyces sp. NP160 TaxID=2586637 RepID=UPI0015D629A0|nr:aminotransferase class I/II-fold pyridoxal phosphate-dependent enzyme [Streptomyces sp. NP160]